MNELSSNSPRLAASTVTKNAGLSVVTVTVSPLVVAVMVGKLMTMSPLVRAMLSVGAMCSLPAKGFEETAFMSM